MSYISIPSLRLLVRARVSGVLVDIILYISLRALYYATKGLWGL